MPARLKQPGQRADKREQRSGPKLALLMQPEPLEPPAGLQASTARAWSAFWRAPVARLVDSSSDLPALERLFRLYDERARCTRVGRKARLVHGSMGQLAINPLLTYAESLTPEIRQLEDRFGLTPMARLRLGLVLGEATKSLEDLNAESEREADHLSPEEADPRLLVLPQKEN